LKITLVLVLLVVLSVSAEDRGELQVSVGAGAWMPSLFNEGSELTPGPAFSVSLQIPPSLGTCFLISAGYLSAGCDRETWDGISGIPLTVGWRLYPFYRKFAGPRGIEPLLGVYGGGALLWDSPSGSQEGTSTGAGIIGAEVGARIAVGGSTAVDLTVSPEWVPAGSSMAGEGDRDLSGLKILASIVF
jgi:hypothetical protein